MKCVFVFGNFGNLYPSVVKRILMEDDMKWMTKNSIFAVVAYQYFLMIIIFRCNGYVPHVAEARARFCGIIRKLDLVSTPKYYSSNSCTRKNHSKDKRMSKRYWEGVLVGFQIQGFGK